MTKRELIAMLEDMRHGDEIYFPTVGDLGIKKDAALRYWYDGMYILEGRHDV